MKSHPLIRFTIGIFIILIGVPPAGAQNFLCSTDVPTILGTTDFLPQQTVFYSGGSWSLDFDGTIIGIPPSATVNAFTYDSNGDINFSLDIPATLGGTTYLPNDIIRYDGSTYSYVLNGTSAGLPPDANIDAVAWTNNNRLVLSFSEPVTIGTTTYMPNDLVEYMGGVFLYYVDASVFGFSEGVNICGIEFDVDAIYITLDEPDTAPAGGPFLPGDIIKFNWSTTTLWFRDPSFPKYSKFDGISFDGPPGDTQNLTLKKIGSATNLELNWTASPCASTDDYGIYEGTIGNWYSHNKTLCSTGGLTTAQITASSGNLYYLVVPLNRTLEGAYGKSSSGSARPRGVTTCRIVQKTAGCP